MKIVVQNFKSGDLSVSHAPAPGLRPGGVLVNTRASLISAGTDRAVVGLAQMGTLAKAKARPDLVRKVIAKAKTDGLWNTFKLVQNRLSEPLPLGYSLVGDVVAVGSDIHDVKVGDRVACAGAGYANHAETVFVPRNLFVPVPAGVDDEDAAYVTLGAIAMHGIRQADQQFGATVLIVGLGLVGQIALQICNAAGLRVIGLDLDRRKTDLAVAQGAVAAYLPDDDALSQSVLSATNGIGVDAAFITAASKDSGAVLDQAASLCRDRARLVVIGDVKMEMSRRLFFEKELEVFQSRSYGPGRYDPAFEEKGQDYPVGYVRWTERRNMQAFLDMLADRRINLDPLTTHRFDHDQAEAAYEVAMGIGGELAIGILLRYPAPPKDSVAKSQPAAPKSPAAAAGRIGLGLIGAGRFAQGVLMPAIMETKGFDLIGVASSGGLSAETVKNKHAGRYAIADGSRVLDDENVEAVVIATRHDSHADYVVEALQRDKHVFVEKPLCLNRDQLTAIGEAAAKSKGTLMVGFNRRFSPCVQDLKAHFRGREEPLAMSYRINAGRIPLDGPDGWVHESEIGGGRIIGEACHFIDTLQAICGARPDRITAHAVNPGNSSLAANDIVTLTIGYDDGSLGTIHYWSNGDSALPKERLEVYGQNRIGILDNFRRLDLAANGRKKAHRTLNQQKGFSEEANAFLQACKSGVPAISLDCLMDTTLTTFLAVEDIAEANAET